MSDTISLDDLEQIVQEEYRTNSAANHRRYERIEFRGPVVLTRFSPETGAPTGTAVVAEGRDLSSGGMRIVHSTELPGSVLAAVLHDSEGTPRKVLVRPLRTKTLDDGRFESACRFVQPQPNLVPAGACSTNS